MFIKLVKYGAQAALGLTAFTAIAAATGYISKDTVRKYYTILAPQQQSRVQVASVEPSQTTANSEAVAPSSAPQNKTSSEAADPSKTVESPSVSTQPSGSAGKDTPTKDASDEDRVATSTDVPKIKPAFDVLRVEKDGSLLVAGRAEPNGEITLTASDGTVIGKARVGSSGDFVILPDQPLPAGDYVLGLNATDAKGNQISSSETSIVSVPKGGGEVLAMITPEGRPSRIISNPVTTAPGVADPISQSDTSAKNVPEETPQATVESPIPTTGKSTGAAETSAEETKSELATASPPSAKPNLSAKVATDQPTETSEISTQIAAGSSEAKAGEQKEADQNGGAVAVPSTAEIASNDATTAATTASAPADQPTVPTSGAAASINQSVETTSESAKSDQSEMASLQPTSEKDTTSSSDTVKSADRVSDPSAPATSRKPEQAANPAQPAPFVAVEAVEIENGRIYVAGAVPKGAAVRVYIDNKSLGITGGTIDNRFLLSRDFALTPGEHVVRADVVDRRTGAVRSRAEVPLYHDAPLQEQASVTQNSPSKTSDPSAAKAQVSPSESKDIEVAKLAAPKTTDVSAAIATTSNKANTTTKTVAAVSIDGTDIDGTDNVTERNTPKASNQSAKSKTAVSESVAETSPAAVEPPASAKVEEKTAEQRVASIDTEKKAVSTLSVKNDDVQANGDVSTAPEEQPAAPVETGHLKNTKTKAVAETAGVATEVNTEPVQTADTPAKPDALETTNTMTTATQSPVVETASSGETATPALTSSPSNQPVAIRTGTAIIIKPGDNLWRISRRTYGRGIRYTTIYNANRDQIRNPNRIYIGQIFKIPDKPEVTTQ